MKKKLEKQKYLGVAKWTMLGRKVQLATKQKTAV